MHADLIVHLILLAVGTEGSLPLVLCTDHHILVLHFLRRGVGHVHGGLPPLGGALPRLTVARLLLGHWDLHFGVLLCILVLHSLFVAQA